MLSSLPGISGTLFPGQFLAEGLAADAAATQPDHVIRQRLIAWWRRVEAACGPATGIRAIFDIAALRLFAALGFRVRNATFGAGGARAWLQTPGDTAIGLIVRPWNERGTGRWREAVEAAQDVGAEWAFVLAPPWLSLVDAAGHATRRAVDVSFPEVFDERAWTRFLLLCRPAAFDPGPVNLRVLCHRAAGFQDRVGRDLERGVLSALESLRPVTLRHDGDAGDADDALTVVYRVLFLLFAESRELVPIRHPIYAQGYSMATLCRDALRGAAPGLWDALAAVTRLSRLGVETGDLIVRPFNGRLFARASAPSLEIRRPRRHARGATAEADEAVRRALVALGTRAGDAGRETIAYADLGVEQLGTVYERVLEHRDTHAPAALRKQTGTFYTPRPLAAFVVRRTLAPLVAGASADEILALRVLDPAMGSGAFLVAACYFLAHAYERAIVDEGRCHESDVTEADRAEIRRLIAERCLAGVDVNPVAVQLARLSLWLTTLARDKPLTFLDHRLRTGNSLIGASPDDIARGAAPRTEATVPLPLFDAMDAADAIASVAAPVRALTAWRDETVGVVRAKEAEWLRWMGAASPLSPWRAACDAWCAQWFTAKRLAPAEWRSVLAALVGGDRTLPAALLAQTLRESSAAAARHGFFHWPLEFADVLHPDSSRPRPRAGFDAVIGNPPWEMLRDDTHRNAGRREETAAVDPATDARRPLARFVRESGRYPASQRGHLNLYQPFLERSLDLTRPGGRVGLLVPWGLATDDGAAAIRARLFDAGQVDTIVGLENSAALFPIHRGLRFMVLVASPGGDRRDIRARYDVRTADELEALPARDDPMRTSFPVRLAPADLRRLGGPTRRIPYVRRASELELLDRLTATLTPIGDAAGWAAQFGRELNATDDRASFGATGLPVIEGKHIAAFAVTPGATTTRISAAAAARLLPDRRYTRPRLAYRDVSGAGNRTTLIAAIVPGGVVTTHTLFCLRTPLPLVQQQALCAVFNSFVANAIVRMLMGSHLTTSLIEQLPAPLWTGTAAQRRIARLSARLTRQPSAAALEAALQAAVAWEYGLDADAFARILDGFPLVSAAARQAALEAFRQR